MILLAKLNGKIYNYLDVQAIFNIYQQNWVFSSKF